MTSALINNGSLLFTGIWAICKTGLVNKVEELLENQQIIKTEVEIIKVRIEK